MKTATVTIRLPVEKIEQFTLMAKAQGCTLSEFVREKALAQVEGKGNGNPEVLKRLEEVAAALAEEQKTASELLVAILRNTVGARYHASLATTYADDIITVMQTGNVLNVGEVENRQAIREKEALRIEEAVIAQVLNSKTKAARNLNS